MNIEILKCLRVRFKEMAPPPSLASRRTRPPAEWFFFSFTVRIYSRYAGQDSMYCMGQVIPPPPPPAHMPGKRPWTGYIHIISRIFIGRLWTLCACVEEEEATDRAMIPICGILICTRKSVQLTVC